MPKIVTPETLRADCVAHAEASRDALDALDAALAGGLTRKANREAAMAAAKRLEAAGCYTRRAVGRMTK